MTASLGEPSDDEEQDDCSWKIPDAEIVANRWIFSLLRVEGEDEEVGASMD